MAEKRKVLVVDDEKDFCRNVKDILELGDYEVAVTHNGSGAIEMVERGSFDLVLMDVMMPGINGVETFRKIKVLAPQTPVILITAYAVEELLKQALCEGVFCTLKKPLDFEKLLTRIEMAVPDGGLLLFADDDKDFCSNMEAILSDKGYRVIVSHDSHSAIQEVREHKFDIIILDMKFPVLNGLETYITIRGIRPDVEVIVITGYPREMGGLAHQALKKCSIAYFQKPLDMDRLIFLLEKIGGKNANNEKH